ncbi:MAG: twin-arginine translocase subunit TatC [Gemmatimonadetes bacterium]|nr:twin-arginine translocase subunit TatC [Gemmatimonadota bacterium]
MRRLREGLLARSDNPKAEMPFLDHLEELRWRILWSLLALILGGVAGLVLVLYFDVPELLIRPAVDLFGEDFRLLTLSPEANFIILLQLSLLVGLILASPVVIYQLWAFFSPALEDREKRAIVPALLMGLVLFVAGVALAYFIVLELALRFLSGILIDYLEASWTANFYLGFVVKRLLAFGIVFELPVVVLVLSVLGIVTPEFLRTKRRHAFVAILLLASFISPGDMINVTIAMTIPLIALYESSIFLSVLVWRKRDAREQEADSSPPDGAVAAEDGDEAGADVTPYNHGDPAGGSAPATPDGDG